MLHIIFQIVHYPNKMENVIPDIISYVGDERQISYVSREWRDRIEQNNRAILDGLYAEYPHAGNIHELVLELVQDNNTEGLRKLLNEYKGYLPVSWDMIIPYISSVDVLMLLNDIRHQDTFDGFLDPLLSQRRRMIADRSMANNVPIENYTRYTMYDIWFLAKMNQLWRLDTVFRRSEQRQKNILRMIQTFLGYIPIEEYNSVTENFDNPGHPEEIPNYQTLTYTVNLDELSFDDLVAQRHIIEFVSEYAELTPRMEQYLHRIEEQIERQTVPPHSDRDEYHRFIDNAVRNRRLHILDELDQKDILSAIVMSYDPQTGRIPRWMYRFLRYKGDQWEIPIGAWIANIVDGYQTRTSPPSDLWRKLLATAAAHSHFVGNAEELVYHLMNKYNDQITTEMEDKIVNLSRGSIEL